MKIHPHLVHEISEAILQIFAEGRYADKVIEKTLKFQKKWGARDRRFFAESVYGMVRWWRKLWVLAGESQPILETHTIEKIWAIWAFEQGWIENPQDWGLPSSDEMKRMNHEFQSTASLAERQSIPDWLDDLGISECGEKRWPLILKSLNEPAPVDLRVNTLKITRGDLEKRLRDEGIETRAIGGVDTGLELVERKNVFITKAFQSGFFEVQDRASQLVAPLLDPKPGERIVDACAGAGGKSLHLAQLMKNSGRLVSMDIHEWKLNELKTRARRAGVSIIEPRVIDSTKVIKRLEASFDGVLLDVPCSGLGVLRRNPDTKWKLTLDEIKRIRELQKDILGRYSKMVKPSGRLVYATCSFLPSENQAQVESFAGSDWEIEVMIKVDPDQGRGDGFFGARLRRKAQV